MRYYENILIILKGNYNYMFMYFLYIVKLLELVVVLFLWYL